MSRPTVTPHRNRYTAPTQQVEAAFDYPFFEFERRNAVDEQTAGTRLCFKNRDRVTELRQFIGACHSARSAADYSDLETIWRSDSCIECLMCKRVFVNELFYRSNRHWIRARIQDAGALAQAVLRADAAANFRHVAGRTRECGGFEEPPFGSEGEPLGNSVPERAAIF